MISVLMKLGAVVAAAFAVLVGLFFYTSIPANLGIYRMINRMDPSTVGLIPAFQQ